MKYLIAIMIVTASALVADGKTYSCGLAGCLPDGCDISEEGIIRHNVYKNGPQLTQEYRADQQLHSSIDPKDTILLPGRIEITEEINILQEPHRCYITDTLLRTEEIRICDYCDDVDVVEYWKMLGGGMRNKFPLFATGRFKICEPCARKALSVVMEIVEGRMKYDPQFRAKFEEPPVQVGMLFTQFLAVQEHTGNVTLHIDASRDWGTREITFETDDRTFTFTQEELKNMLNGKIYTAKVKVKK